MNEPLLRRYGHDPCDRSAMSVPGACAAFGAFNLAMLLVVAAMVDAIIGRSADAVLEILGSGLCFSLYRDR